LPVVFCLFFLVSLCLFVDLGINEFDLNFVIFS